MFQRSTEYAFRAMTYLARQPAGRVIHANDIHVETKVPLPYLWKVLRGLADRKLIRSFKGKSGGYQLGRSARSIVLSDIVSAISGETVLGRCPLDSSECDKDEPCVVHNSWQVFCRQLKRETLADLAHRGH